MILARSGIGPVAELQALDIAPVVDLPGAGSNLVDRPLISIDLPTRPSPGPSRFQAHVPFCGSGPRRTRRLGAVHCGPVRRRTGPKSEWRRVRNCCRTHGTPIARLGTFGFRKPSNAPGIHLAYLTDADDLERMLDAVTEAQRLALSEPVAAITAGTELSPGPAFPTDNRDAAWVRAAVSTFLHPVGTCAIGPDPALGVVTDSRGSVHGIDGITIADASIMPTIPTATTNLPTIMVAEHIARWLRSTQSDDRDSRN